MTEIEATNEVEEIEESEAIATVHRSEMSAYASDEDEDEDEGEENPRDYFQPVDALESVWNGRNYR